MYNFLSRPNFCLRSVRNFFSPPKCRKNQSPEVLLMIFCSIMFFSLSQHQSESDFLKNNVSVARTWGFPKTINHFSEGSTVILWIFSRGTFYVFCSKKFFLPLSTPIQGGISRICQLSCWLQLKRFDTTKAGLGTDWWNPIVFGQIPIGEGEIMLFTMPWAQMPTFDLMKGDRLRGMGLILRL